MAKKIRQTLGADPTRRPRGCSMRWSTRTDVSTLGSRGFGAVQNESQPRIQDKNRSRGVNFDIWHRISVHNDLRLSEIGRCARPELETNYIGAPLICGGNQSHEDWVVLRMDPNLLVTENWRGKHHLINDHATTSVVAFEVPPLNSQL